MYKPSDHQRYGRMVQGFVEATWIQHARDIVKRGSRAKYTQHPVLLTALLATKGKTLVEASPKDRLWGIGLGKEDPRAWDRSTWLGLNWLGQVLTDVQEEFEAKDPA